MKKYAPFIIAVILIFMAIVSLLNARNDAITFDEVAHIPAGYSYLTELDTRLNPEHPPLFKLLAGLPLLAMDLQFDTTQDFWTMLLNGKEFGQWDAGKHLLFEAGNDPDAIAFWSRVPMVVLSLALGILLFAWGKRLGGVSAGLLALTLYAFDPNILGHNHFVTTDLGIATATALAFWGFLTFLKKPTWGNALLGGALFGVAQVTKFSAVMLLPIFGLLLILYPLVKDTDERMEELFTYIKKGLVAMGVALLVIWGTYLPFTATMPQDVLAQIGPAQINPDTTIRNEIALDVILWTNQHDLTRSLGMYTQGLTQVFHRVAGGNGAYFLGEVSNEAFPTYFPTVFFFKQTIPHLLFYLFGISLFVLLCVRTLRATIHQPFRRSWQRLRRFVFLHFTECALFFFIVFYSYISITGNLNIGFRHLFPILPLLYILIAKVSVDTITQVQHSLTAARLRTTAGVVIAVMVIEVLVAYPFYLSYFNEFAGGPKNGYHIVTDSNSDWGQDLKRLKAYLDEHSEIDTIRVDYFGGDRPERLLGEKMIPWWDSKRPIEKGYYAISVNFRQGSIFDTRKTKADSYQWLLDYRPIDQVGTSILIYRID